MARTCGPVRPELGIVADDVTGACDVASAVRAAGWSVAVVLGDPTGSVPEAHTVPGGDAAPDTDCVVVALPVRQVPADQAVAASVAAARWLVDAGVRVVYQKYCSTFDSTEQGNIGPIGCGLLELAESCGADRPRSVGTPATPAVGRTSYLGYLFVHDRLLEHSAMRDHPLTPMRESWLPGLLSRQLPTTDQVGLVPLAALDAGPAQWADHLGSARHVLLDALTDADLDRHAVRCRTLLGGWPDVVYAGGAGFAAALARAYPAPAQVATAGEQRARPGRRLVVAGSCSARTLEQIDAFTGPVVAVRAEEVMSDRGRAVDRVVAELAAVWRTAPNRVALVHSSVPPAVLAAGQARFGAAALAAAVEAVLGEVARRATDELGVTAVISAGGETSGAVTRALGARRLRVGPDAATGVPWTYAPDGTALLLKSGNFGEPDLFRTAWSVLDSQFAPASHPSGAPAVPNTGLG